ncbi:unnamed protein product [Parascedosporium putredinis]|uniref:Alpha/beta hydrolase fold-3 domain-containing protein n=1 Tax=Parascedosporium putredinis TaxID=1442378 RepID=A0A9P1M8Y6_9PEZI|nr:unnamed protein product [Parascedosporium putredinis]CAI7994713.1 unnamed protein product [Parascedosporium putredinis]
MSGLRYDAEFASFMAAVPAGPEKPDFQNVHELRDWTDKLLHLIFRMAPTPPTVETLEFKVPSTHDGADITVVRFAEADVLFRAEPQAAIIYFHGGGMVASSVETFGPSVARHASASGVVFFAVDYRLAPEYPAPAGVEDGYAALKYVSENALEFHIDPARIAVMGDSGGGCIAAGVALMARDRALSPPLAKQILIYPMLDDRTKLDKDADLHKFLTWQLRDNVMAWNALLGEDKAGNPDAEVNTYAVPARNTNLRGLPQPISMLADVEVEFHLWAGVPHGFEGAATTAVVKSVLAARTKAMTSF